MLLSLPRSCNTSESLAMISQATYLCQHWPSIAGYRSNLNNICDLNIQCMHEKNYKHTIVYGITPNRNNIGVQGQWNRVFINENINQARHQMLTRAPQTWQVTPQELLCTNIYCVSAVSTDNCFCFSEQVPVVYILNFNNKI